MLLWNQFRSTLAIANFMNMGDGFICHTVLVSISYFQGISYENMKDIRVNISLS